MESLIAAHFQTEQFLSLTYLLVIFVDLLILFGLLLCARKLFAIRARVADTTHELAEKDNAAFGISLGGAVLALGVMMTGVVEGDVLGSLVAEFSTVLGFGVGGILLLFLTRRLFERLAYPGEDFPAQIRKGNVAAAVIDSGNLIATAVIIRTMFAWVEGGDAFVGGPVIIVAFLAAQVMLALTMRYRIGLFARRNEGRRFADEIDAGNAPLAIRCIGFQIGAALSIANATGLVPYHSDPAGAAIAIGVWILFALLLLALMTALVRGLEKIVLHGVDVAEEVDRQRNLGVAVLEAAAYSAAGLMIGSLVG